MSVACFRKVGAWNKFQRGLFRCWHGLCMDVKVGRGEEGGARRRLYPPSLLTGPPGTNSKCHHLRAHLSKAESLGSVNRCTLLCDAMFSGRVHSLRSMMMHRSSAGIANSQVPDSIFCTCAIWKVQHNIDISRKTSPTP